MKNVVEAVAYVVSVVLVVSPGAAMYSSRPTMTSLMVWATISW